VDRSEGIHGEILIGSRPVSLDPLVFWNSMALHCISKRWYSAFASPDRKGGCRGGRGCEYDGAMHSRQEGTG